MSTSFLTKIVIDHETAYNSGLRDSYSWHQKIWKAFPGRDGETRNFLTRLDEVDGGLRLLTLSEQPPDRPDWCPEPAWESKPVPDTFFTHPRFRFSLVANPTRKVRSEKNPKNGRRVPVSHREDREVDGKLHPGLISWLHRKGEQHGFSFDPAHVRTAPRQRQSFIKKGSAGLHAATEFSGILEVTDPEKFRHAALHGIGSAKAFGFGMLCLAPAS